jgi:hypothetical protein
MLTFAQDTPFYLFIGIPALDDLFVGFAVHFGARKAKRVERFRSYGIHCVARRLNSKSSGI